MTEHYVIRVFKCVFMTLVADKRYFFIIIRRNIFANRAISFLFFILIFVALKSSRDERKERCADFKCVSDSGDKLATFLYDLTDKFLRTTLMLFSVFITLGRCLLTAFENSRGLRRAFQNTSFETHLSESAHYNILS